MRELYPQGPPTLEKHDGLLHLHARKLETGVQQDVAGTQQHNALCEEVDELRASTDKKLDKIDREMSTQTQDLIEIKLSLATREGDTKRLNVWLALVGPIITALLMAAITYAMRPPTGPGPVHLTNEQLQLLHDQEAAAKR